MILYNGLAATAKEGNNALGGFNFNSTRRAAHGRGVCNMEAANVSWTPQNGVLSDKAGLVNSLSALIGIEARPI